MNTEAAIAVLNTFLGRSPRSAMEVQVLLKGQHWCWRHGRARDIPSPVFEIGSVGKTFTTTLLAVLVEQGEVSLNDPVSRFHPELPFGDRVTLQQLASHTSGLPRYEHGIWQMMRHGRELAEAAQPGDLMAFLQQQPPVLQRAGKVNYSNLGMALLGHILGEVCGQPYDEAVQSRVLEPLGMHDTFTAIQAYAGERLIQGHDTRGRPVPPFVWPGMEPAGVWRSTGDDMLRFLQAQLGLSGEPWASIAALTTRPGTRVSGNTRVGLGWMLSEHPPYGQAAWHNGGTFGQHSMVAWILNPPAAVVLLTDRAPPTWHHFLPGRQLEGLPQRLLKALAQEY